MTLIEMWKLFGMMAGCAAKGRYSGALRQWEGGSLRGEEQRLRRVSWKLEEGSISGSGW